MPVTTNASKWCVNLWEKMSNLPICWTILSSICESSTYRRPFYVNLYCQIASRIIQNQQQNFLTSPPTSFEQSMVKKKSIWSHGASLLFCLFFPFWGVNRQKAGCCRPAVTHDDVKISELTMKVTKIKESSVGTLEIRARRAPILLVS